MQYCLFDNMNECSDADVRRLLSIVAEQRCRQALRYRHLFGQWSTLKTWEMLGSLLKTDSYSSLPWQYNEFGKPYIDGAPEFSISHCKHALLVAVDANPIGVDIESIRVYNDSLARRVMNEQEMAQIDADIDGKAVGFTRLWTQKEAVLKLRGTGIVDDLKQVLVGACEKLSTYSNLDRGYCFTIAETNTQSPLI